MFLPSSAIFLYIFCNLDVAVFAKQRILGGRNAHITKIPYQLSLESKDKGELDYKHICGAAVIDKQWALTAAHCVKGQYKLRIRAGETYRGNGEIYFVKRSFIHERYDDTTDDYDIALLKVLKPFTYSTSVKPIPLAKNIPATGTRATVSGWGATKDGGKAALKLQKVMVKILSTKKCSKALEETITKRMFCAGFMRGGKDSCQGDSGGPLAYRGKLIGIVSWGDGCGQKRKPGVYANVPNLRNWIKRALTVNRFS